MVADAVPIFIDDREGSGRLSRYPALSDAVVVRLDAGDVAFPGNGPHGEVMVGVEVKSIWDLMSSINTGRLQGTQVPAMLDAYPVPWLAYYGEYRPGNDGMLQLRKGAGWRSMRFGSRSVPYGYLEAFLLDLAALGLGVKRCSTEAELVCWLVCLHRWWSKPWSKHRGMRAFDQSREMSLMPTMDADVHLRARIAKELPGVGFERAVAAANHFGSVREMVLAPIQEWVKIPGIGKVVARSVVESLE